MKTLSPHEIELAAGVVVLVLIGCGAFAYFMLRRRKSPAEIERLRRLSLGLSGRITAGEVTGLIEPEGEKTALELVYRYDIAGVTYEVTQDVSALPEVAAAARQLMGKGISVKYETKHPSNSIAACEIWSGISGINASDPGGRSSLSASSAETKKL